MKAESTVTVLLALLVGLGSFWDGLYAPAQHLVGTAFVALAFLRVSPGVVSLARPEAGAWVLLAVGTGLSLVGAVGMGSAAHGPPVVTGWLLAMALGRHLAGTGLVERILVRTWASAGALMAFGGLAAISYLPEHHSHRLASFLGYPVAVGLLGMLGAAGALSLRSPWLRRALLFSNLMAVFLSGSRGVWAVVATLALYLGIVRRESLRGAWLPLLGALTAALWAGPAVVSRAPGPALVAAALTGLTVVVAGQFHKGIQAVAGNALIAGAALAPGWPWLLGRVQALSLTEGSAVERLTMLRDGLRLMTEHPLGAGYRAWAALHLQGSAYGYYSAEPHSAVTDVGLAFGWVGAAAFLLLLTRFLLSLRAPGRWDAERLVVLAALGALGLHSLVDWDLSYATFALPLWLGFGLAGGGGGLRLSAAALTGLAGAALAVVIIMGAGDAFTAAAFHSAAPAPIAARRGAVATALTPWNDAAHAALALAYSRADQREAAIAELVRARALGPREPWYAELHARELAAAGPSRWREAGAAYQDFTRLWPWSVPAYETALGGLMDLALRATLQGDVPLAADLTERGRAILTALDRQRASEPPGMPRKAMQTDTPALRRAREFFRA